MATVYNDFAGLDEFSQEDNAQFGTGTNDLYLSWASQQNLDDGSVISGWYAKTNREDFNKACDAYNASHAQNPIRRVTATYTDNAEEIWVLPSGLSLFVVCKGLGEAYRSNLTASAADLGIVNVWSEETIEETKKGVVQRRVSRKSHLHFRAIIADLVEYGWGELVQIRTKGQGKAGYALKMLQAQQATLTAFRGFIGKKDLPLPFYSFSIPTGCSKLVEIGQKPNSKKMILPVSLAPEKPEKAYFLAHYLNNHPLADVIKAMIDDAMPETIAWAKSNAIKLYSGSGDTEVSENNGNGSSYQNAPEASFENDAPIFDEEGIEVATSTRKPMVDDAEPASDTMREGLRKLAIRKGIPGLNKTASNPQLTRGMARAAIQEANGKPDVRQN